VEGTVDGGGGRTEILADFCYFGRGDVVCGAPDALGGGVLVRDRVSGFFAALRPVFHQVK
jgi:hypothetical protein